MRPCKLNAGDTITFKATGCRWPTRTEKRKCTGFWPDGRPTVRYNGHPDFVLNWSEIKGIERL